MEYKVNNNFNYTLLKNIVEKDGLRAFKFHKKIADNTSQGSVGILKCIINDIGCTETLYGKCLGGGVKALTMARDYIVEKKGRDEKNNEDLIIYKIGTETPFLCRHEHDVSISLHKLSTYLPNFMRPFDLIRNARADPRQKNPFVSYIQNDDCKKRSRHTEGIKRVRPKTFSDMALFEYIDSNITLAQLLTFNVKGRRQTRVTSQDDLEKIKASQPNIINSLLNQLMIATIIAQQKLLFIHNDLHFDNVLVSKCLERTFMLYVFDINRKGAIRRHEDTEKGEEENVICYALLPTCGYYPTIIDYGFSFSKDLIGGPLLTGIHHNNKGYMNHQYDEFTDFKTMLVRLAYSEYQFGLNDKDDFQNIVRKELLNRLPIDRQTGWDDTKDISVSKQLVRHIRLFIDDYLKNANRESFFQKHEYELVDMICSLIILPLRKKNSDTLIDSLQKFFGEWFKIERWIGTSHMKIFVFKSIVDKIREDLLTKTECNMEDFQKTIYKIMNEVGDNIILSHLDYELFYKSIISLSDCFEDIMFKANQKCVKRKEKEYSRLRMKTSLDMYQLVEPFISVDYEIRYGDYFVVLNAINETTSSFVINDTCTREFIDTVNDMDRTERAEYLFKSMV